MPTLRRLRHRANLAKVASGDTPQVAEVVRDLAGMSRRTGLSHGEGRMLFKARQPLVLGVGTRPGLHRRIRGGDPG